MGYRWFGASRWGLQFWPFRLGTLLHKCNRLRQIFHSSILSTNFSCRFYQIAALHLVVLCRRLGHRSRMYKTTLNMGIKTNCKDNSGRQLSFNVCQSQAFGTKLSKRSATWMSPRSSLVIRYQTFWQMWLWWSYHFLTSINCIFVLLKKPPWPVSLLLEHCKTTQNWSCYMTRVALYHLIQIAMTDGFLTDYATAWLLSQRPDLSLSWVSTSMMST